jgi:3-isopropylmalate/(R)-2-methylmalate dehydratase small subunit
MNSSPIIKKIQGIAIPLHGNDIDTDRIIPARFLKCVVFNELGPHAFEDDRKSQKDSGITHPFDDPKYSQGSILVVNKNFGCGSSREHAPQSLIRWGIRAIIGESFAEIFYANCLTLGVPCVTMPQADITKIMSRIESDADTVWELDLESSRFSGPEVYDAGILPGSRDQLLSGNWNPLSALLANKDNIQKVASQLPYLNGWK